MYAIYAGQPLIQKDLREWARQRGIRLTIRRRRVYNLGTEPRKISPHQWVHSRMDGVGLCEVVFRSPSGELRHGDDLRGWMKGTTDYTVPGGFGGMSRSPPILREPGLLVYERW